MDTISTENKTKTAFSDANGTNGQHVPADPRWPVPDFKYNLSDNPLWPDFLNELKAQREADIVESNRLVTGFTLI